jgi:hypothetical protein
MRPLVAGNRKGLARRSSSHEINFVGKLTEVNRPYVTRDEMDFREVTRVGETGGSVELNGSSRVPTSLSKAMRKAAGPAEQVNAAHDPSSPECEYALTDSVDSIAKERQICDVLSVDL